ncbi:jun dimerization protein 2-like [Narcine bancroftii]|uniref:jun dimerization protein 2-like n=1 Tax=Narcine bancroftii TaxID=1343680 RepID=UPI0038317639
MDGAGPRERRAAPGSPPGTPENRTCHFLDMMPAQSVGPSLVAGALPILSTLTSKELKLGGLCHLSGVIPPLHYLAVRYSRQAHPLKGEADRDDERRRRRREKNKVAAARCRNKKRERTEFLQRESERLELMNGELKTQIENLKRERQDLIHLLNRHRPTCIVRTDSVRTPETEVHPLLQQLQQ